MRKINTNLVHRKNKNFIKVFRTIRNWIGKWIQFGPLLYIELKPRMRSTWGLRQRCNKNQIVISSYWLKEIHKDDRQFNLRCATGLRQFDLNKNLLRWQNNDV